MEVLPQDLYYEIVKYLPANIILNLCQTNKYIYHICQNDQFWYEKVYYDYPDYDGPILTDYKQLYLKLSYHYLKNFIVLFEYQVIGHVWLFKTNTESEIYEFIKNIINSANMQGEYHIYGISANKLVTDTIHQHKNTIFEYWNQTVFFNVVKKRTMRMGYFAQ
jgi:hypothetical protein